MMRRFTYLLSVLALISCDRIASEPDDFKRELVTQMATKGTGSGNVYRIYLNGRENYDTRGIEVSGTYADLASGSPLVPCSITGELEFDDENPECGLRARDGDYMMHIVYPAVTMVPIDRMYTGGEDRGINGYLVKRILGTDDREIYFSPAREVKLSGVYLFDTRSNYIFDASDMPLKQPRSRVAVNFRCGEKIPQTTLRRVSFKNIVQQGYFRPVDGIYYFLNDGSDADNVTDVVLFESAEGELITQEHDKALDETYILSMDYGELTAQGNLRWPVPSLVFETGGSENPVVFTVSLGWNFEQQKEYVFNITMNSTYVNMEVEVLDWDDVDADASVDNPQKWSVDFSMDGDNDFAWTPVTDIVGTIGGGQES